MLFSLLYNQASAQFTVSGRLTDEQEQPIEYAEVSIKNINDTLKMTTTLTDKMGNFSLSIPKGTYLLSVDYIGQNLLKKNVSVVKDINLGMLQVNTINQIGKVTVTGKKPLIERKIDRLVFNVENSISASGGSALEALKLTPRIKVKNDQISMIGKGSMRVMINDRLVKLSGEELVNFLKTLNAEDLKKIEVIPNPPAKYSAEGNSGLINIVTKKPKNNAWNGSLKSIYQQATYAKGKIGGSYNLQKGKIQFTSNINYINGSNAIKETNQIYYPNLTWKEVNNKRDFTYDFSTRLSAEYKINDKLSTGVTYHHDKDNPLRKEMDNTRLFNPGSNELDSIMTTLARNEFDEKLNDLNYHFIYNIDTIGRKLSLDFDFFDYKIQTNRPFKTQSFLAEDQSFPYRIVEARNYSVQQVKNYSVNLDMEHPTDWVNLNYGGRISFTKIDNLSNYFDIENEKEKLNPNFSNEFNYKENTRAIYLSAKKSFSDKYEIKAGLRYELSQTKGFSKTLQQTHTNHYSKFFPTVYFSYTPNKHHSFNINYGKRIERPGYGSLNPFRFVFNPYSYYEGNPFLKPDFKDNIEFEYAFKDHLITTIYYSYTDDYYEQVTILDKKTNVQKITPLNFLVNNMFGVYQIFIFKPFQGWEVNASADVYYSSTRSKIPVTLQYLSGWNGEFNISNDFILNKNKTLSANISYNYTTKGVDHLYYNSSANQLDASIKWLLIDKKLIVSFYINDLLSSNRFTYKTFSSGIENSIRNYDDERYFRLGVIYHFGKKFKRNNRARKNSEEYKRIN